jgi:O-antigen ligase
MTTHPTKSQAGGEKPLQRQNSPTNTSPITLQAPNLSPLLFAILGILLAIGAGVFTNYTADLSPILILGGAVGLLLAVSVFQKPELGAYLLIFSVFTNFSDLFTEKGLPSINQPLVALVVLSIFVNYTLRTGKLSTRPKITVIEFVLGIYILSILGSSFFAVDQAKSLSALIDLIKDIAVGYCIYLTLDTKEKVKTGVAVLLIAVTFASILGVIKTATGTSSTFWGFAQESIFGQVSDTDGELRYAGPLGESNIWGQVLVSSLPLALYLIVRAPRGEIFSKILPALSALFILIAMLFTESRGAVLALICILGLISLDLRIKASTFMLLFSGLLVLLFILPAKYTDRIKSLDVLFQDQEYGYTSDESIDGRRAKMLIGIAMFTNNPFLGVGFANYSENYVNYGGSLGLSSSVLDIGSEEDSQYQPHSLYVEILAETGVFGFASFLTFLGLILKELYGTRKRNRASNNWADREWSLLTAAIMMSIITYLIAGFFLHGVGFRFLWVLIGLGHAFVYLGKRQTAYPALT